MEAFYALYINFHSFIYIYIYIKAHRREMERGEDRQKFRGRARKRGIETNGSKGGTLEVGRGGGGV